MTYTIRHMKDACTLPVATVSLPALQVLACWDVDDGPTYDVRRHDPASGRLIAVRTRKGAGRVYLSNGRTMELRAGSAVVLSSRAITRYQCLGPRWAFWWVEFTVAGARHFPVGAVQPVSGRPGEAQDFRSFFALLRRAAAPQRALAAARFAGLLYYWMEKAAGETPSRHEEMINLTIDRLMVRLEEGWSVQAMAATAGMSERAFRNAFREVTGVAPKVFYDRTRLALAEELLTRGTYNVAEIANRLGYSSPFHFSKAFKQQYGLPPASWLQN